MIDRCRGLWEIDSLMWACWGAWHGTWILNDIPTCKNIVVYFTILNIYYFTIYLNVVQFTIVYKYYKCSAPQTFFAGPLMVDKHVFRAPPGPHHLHKVIKSPLPANWNYIFYFNITWFHCTCRGSTNRCFKQALNSTQLVDKKLNIIKNALSHPPCKDLTPVQRPSSQFVNHCITVL